jgi:acylphosphatase
VRRVRVRVAGRVQGVFFRVTCARRARELGLAGSVSNLADGSVQAVFEGDGSAVEAAVEWCRRGPPMAEVTLIEVVEESIQGSRDFVIVD